LVASSLRKKKKDVYQEEQQFWGGGEITVDIGRVIKEERGKKIDLCKEEKRGKSKKRPCCTLRKRGTIKDLRGKTTKGQPGAHGGSAPKKDLKEISRARSPRATNRR